MSVKIIEHNELKLIGIPCVSLKEMPSKYQNAKEGLLSASKHLPHIVNRQIHYGIWPHGEEQKNPETHVYILCVEVSSFDGIPEWFFKTMLSPQQCVVGNDNSDRCFDAAGEKIKKYIQEKGLKTSAGDRLYTICERYSYEGEGYSRYSLPII
ncbi:GyrI-like domain-containing protein [Evansella tamaricis]|uniref:GyrI-like domain-containing protein n=1 Tax=Evansella tamaricis TaxID=2069301 RepID=A0ABS6JJ90_9BACI|nr:GyrI-like domain-containing protein [Evansella tamaricis]MBU9713651.1 GyrI-like domain-containing protein [Evansella tamaricis]